MGGGLNCDDGSVCLGLAEQGSSGRAQDDRDEGNALFLTGNVNFEKLAAQMAAGLAPLEWYQQKYCKSRLN